MSPFDYILQILENFQLLKIFVVVFVLALLLNQIIFKKLFNGLILLVFSSSIVFSVIIDFYLSKQIDNGKLVYFIFSDFLIYLIVLFIYKRVITTINKKQIFEILTNINEKHFFKVVIWIVIGIVINLLNVSWDGSSRITFQTSSWFSIVRMIGQLIDPVIGLLIVYNLYENKKGKLIILSLLVILQSGSSGSKSGFVFFFAEYFLIYRDLINVKYKLSVKVYAPLISTLILATFLNFYILGVDFDKVFERLVHYAESTIMVYPSENPCAVCQNQSMIALLHRGVGRAIHDPSSLSIDNLFGFALSAEFYGENTLTGPNARIGAYSLCAFPGYKIYILYLVFITFLAFNYLLVKITARRPNFLYISVILLVFHGIQHFLLDYNTAMSDLSLIFMILLFISIWFIFKLNIFKTTSVSIKS